MPTTAPTPLCLFLAALDSLGGGYDRPGKRGHHEWPRGDGSRRQEQRAVSKQIRSGWQPKLVYVDRCFPSFPTWSVRELQTTSASRLSSETVTSFPSRLRSLPPYLTLTGIFPESASFSPSPVISFIKGTYHHQVYARAEGIAQHPSILPLFSARHQHQPRPVAKGLYRAAVISFRYYYHSPEAVTRSKRGTKIDITGSQMRQQSLIQASSWGQVGGGPVGLQANHGPWAKNRKGTLISANEGLPDSQPASDPRLEWAPTLIAVFFFSFAKALQLAVERQGWCRHPNAPAG